LSQIFTIHDNKKCEICNGTMRMLQAGRYKCFECGAKEDNY